MGKAVGIDLGAEALRGVVLDDVQGRLQLVSAGTMPLGELGVLDDSEDKRLAIEEKLKKLVREARLKAPLRRVGLSGKTTELRYLQVPPVPPWRLEMLAKYEVEERSSDKLPKTFDYRILDLPDVGGQYTVLVGSCHETTSRWVLDLGRKARLGEVEIDLEVLGLYNAYYHGHGFDPDQTVLVMDIGAEEVHVLLVKNGALYLARTFLGGGRRFSQMLADELKVDPLEAEEIKKASGEICFDLPSSGNTRFLRTGRTTVLGGSLRRGPAQAAEAAAARTEPLASAAPPEAQPATGAAGTPDEVQDILRRAHEEAKDLNSRDDLELALSPSDANGAGAPGLPVAAAPAAPETPAERRRRLISAALVRETAALCAAIENALSNCRQQIKQRDLKVDKVYLSGGGSRLKGLAEFISRRMRVPVEPLQVFRNVGLERFPAEAAEALRNEQTVLAGAAGLALSGLRHGAFSFLLWPAELKAQKEFRARGAFLYYAAAALMTTLLLFWFTPKRNTEVLNENRELAARGVETARVTKAGLERLVRKDDELRRRLNLIEDNSNSGDFFLKVLAELNKRTPSYIYLTSISTSMPAWAREDDSEKSEGSGGGIVEPGKQPAKPAAKAAKGEDLPETLQAQARIYIRGFVRSGGKSDLMEKIIWSPADGPFKAGFCDLLVPHPDEPDHPENLFKDIRPIKIEKHGHAQGQFVVKEFVLEAFIEGTRDAKKGVGARAGLAPSAQPAEKTFSAAEAGSSSALKKSHTALP